MHPTLTTAVQKRHHFHTLRHGVAAIGLGLGMALSALAADASPAVAATAATPAVISDTALASGAEIILDIDAVGSTIAGAGLKVTLIGTRA